MTDERFSRNHALFGSEGQSKIFNSHVGVVGLGGLGSHIAQQLTYLGVGTLTFVDGDLVTRSSLNRLVGAIETDVHMPKVNIAERQTRNVFSKATVSSNNEWLEVALRKDVLSSCTSVFSCLDSDLVRVALVEFCAGKGIPFFDLATDTGHSPDNLWYGGRVLFSGFGERCPACMDLLDQTAMAQEGLDDEQKEVDARIYGVDRHSLEDTGPAVVSLNGVVASLAVTEWMVWTTGLREPKALLQYRGHQGIVTFSSDTPSEGCYYCSLWPKRTLS